MVNYKHERSHEIPPKASVKVGPTIDEEVFGAAFSGHVVRRFIKYVAAYKVLLWIAIIAVLVFTISSIAIPLIVKNIFDDALSIETMSRSKLATMIVVFLGAIGFNFVSNYLQELIVGRVAERILIDMRRAMYTHLQSVSLSFMDKTEIGKLMARLQGDVAALQEFLQTAVFAIGDLVLIIGIIGAMIWLDWRLGVMTLSVVPILLIIRIVWLPYARKAFLRARVTSSIVSGALAENINGIRAVQGMSREYTNYDLFDIRASDNLKAAKRASKLGVMMLPIVDTLTGASMAIIVIIGGFFVLGGSIEVGVMVAFILFVQRFFDPIRALTMHYNVLQRAMASGERIFEVIDVPVDIKDKPGAVDLNEIDGSIKFENVTFGYLPDQPILKKINFEVKPGETVALVGPTGSGKTSTTALVHRFYDIWEGSVQVGGHDVRDVTQKSLGKHVSMVLQEPFLFSGTIYDNIRYAKHNVTREEVVSAAQAVGAHEFIMKLPNGYDTDLEQRGGNLSLGQRQLISFARAIVADAKILVLDEATASIDSYTEMLIQQALARLMEGRTGMVIAHRLATIRGADRIIVLQDGEIIEMGNHDELIKKEGLYFRLYSMNYASFDDIPDELIAQATKDSGHTAT
ncbi:MAG: ABC transporter ATP-binding protein [SAR202 cluster bacterium]|nr:multidrug ABC transporter [Chloroflexota bacterium]MQG88832.1 ABC transporter ATP-binding protein [SAR202 cluster bacterium]|tara:strand:+ start:2045 stop:3934 length:1890 start_codon:yes stop_codon:yes gene_type:complete